ncbi:MAG: T9SS type A sorting domain-containing protein [Calditrichota bacterium]
MKRIVSLLFFITAITGLSWADTTWVEQGDANGQWTMEDSPYMITGHLQVIGRDTLFVERGVRIVFTGPYRIYVFGGIEVYGTAENPVVFTADTTVNQDGWGGLRFISAHALSHLNYCIIENGRAEGSAEYGLGGGIYCENSQVELNHSEIRFCKAGSGHGIYARERSKVNLNETVLFSNGSDVGSGGGICLRVNSELVANGAVFDANKALYGGGITTDESTVTLQNCVLRKNTASVNGGGIFSTSSTVTLKHTFLLSNLSIGGGGMDGRSNTTLLMDRCVVAGNSAVNNGAQGNGGGLLLQSGPQQISHCTFMNNEAMLGGAIYGGTALTVRSSIFARQVDGGGMYFPLPGVNVRYSCFFDNTDGNFNGPQMPRDLGTLVSINANYDSCDVYRNILLNPLFDDSSANMYALTAGSPCIDAGDPNLPVDPDGSLPDQGAFWFSPLTADEPVSLLPQAVALHPAYPNPFNPSTHLDFDVARTGLVSLQVFDLLGRRVATLINTHLQPGSYSASWNAADVPSGTYFAVLEEGGVRFTQKLLLLK